MLKLTIKPTTTLTLLLLLSLLTITLSPFRVVAQTTHLISQDFQVEPDAPEPMEPEEPEEPEEEPTADDGDEEPSEDSMKPSPKVAPLVSIS